MLAVDIFGGYASHVGYGSADEATVENGNRFQGWDLGASLRPLPWLGLTGTVSRTSKDDTRIMHYLGGPRLMSSYGGNYYGLRGFVHVLLGAGSVSVAGQPSSTGLEVLAGAGFDWYVVRMQLDYLRLPSGVRETSGTPAQQNQMRLMVGGVLPLCFSGCRPNDVDGIDLSR
jgi:hypothetical protein